MKPMLAAKAGALSLLRYPVLATPKLDGIRCMTLEPDYGNNVIAMASIQCQGVTRRLNPIGNQWIRSKLDQYCPPGLDGEIITGETIDGEFTPHKFNQISSDVQSYEGFPEFRYVVFDYGHNHSLVPPFPQIGYWKRCRQLEEMNLPDFCIKLMPMLIKDAPDLSAYESACLLKGFEGVMIRTPDSPYKFGRSTLREQWLIKIKQFLDAEAVVTGVYEKMHNANPGERSVTGALERSSHQENMVPTGTLGGLEVKDIKTGVSFNVGSGFTDADRHHFWAQGSTLIGKIITYRYQPYGVHEKPRFPIFRGFRSPEDMP